MQKISFILITIMLVITVLLPLLKTIETGFKSTDGYYGDVYEKVLKY